MKDYSWLEIQFPVDRWEDSRKLGEVAGLEVFARNDIPKGEIRIVNSVSNEILGVIQDL